MHRDTAPSPAAVLLHSYRDPSKQLVTRCCSITQTAASLLLAELPRDSLVQLQQQQKAVYHSHT
jgi:hypothetical protein